MSTYSKSAFKAALLALAAQESISDSDFSDAVYQAVAQHGLSQQVLQDELEASPATLDRWYQGQNLPPALARRKIILLVAALISL